MLLVAPLPLTPAPVLTLPAPCQPSILYLDRLVSGQAAMTAAGLGPNHLAQDLGDRLASAHPQLNLQYHLVVHARCARSPIQLLTCEGTQFPPRLGVAGLDLSSLAWPAR